MIEYDDEAYRDLIETLEDLLFDLLDMEGVTDDQVLAVVTDVLERYRW
jgi:hypothetical protein